VALSGGLGSLTITAGLPTTIVSATISASAAGMSATQTVRVLAGAQRRRMRLTGAVRKLGREVAGDLARVSPLASAHVIPSGTYLVMSDESKTLRSGNSFILRTCWRKWLRY